jgi:hypothetical protein
MCNRPRSINLIYKLLNQDMSYVLASGRDRSGKPGVRNERVLAADSPVPLRLAWQPAMSSINSD